MKLNGLYPLVGLLTLGVLLPSGSAQAELKILEESGEWESPKQWSLSFSGGGYDVEDDEDLIAVYGKDSMRQLTLNTGYVLIDQLHLNASFVGLKEKGEALGVETGTVSGETFTMQLFIASFGATARLDFLADQFLVPYGGFGVSWAVFKESGSGADDESSTDDSSNTNDDQVHGDRKGYNLTAGVEFLLDKLEPARASDLDISQGINNTYLFVEVRKQILTDLGTESLDFSGESLSVGLKFEF